MKKVFFIAALAVASFSVKAQDEAKPLTFSIGAEAALPVGDLADGSSFGAGASLQGNFNLDETLALTLNAGYLNYFGKDGGESLGVIPILAGIEYNFTPQVFASAQLGYSIYTGKVLSDNDLKMSGFTYAPGIGFRITPNFSAMLKYQGTSAKAKYDGGPSGDSQNLGHIGLRLAYSF